VSTSKNIFFETDFSHPKNEVGNFWVIFSDSSHQKLSFATFTVGVAHLDR
jgi:hypothetical protein